MESTDRLVLSKVYAAFCSLRSHDKRLGRLPVVRLKFSDKMGQTDTADFGQFAVGDFSRHMGVDIGLCQQKIHAVIFCQPQRAGDLTVLQHCQQYAVYLQRGLIVGVDHQALLYQAKLGADVGKEGSL